MLLGKDMPVGDGRPRVLELVPRGGWLRARWLLASEEKRGALPWPLLTPGLLMRPRPRPGKQMGSSSRKVHGASIGEARRPGV